MAGVETPITKANITLRDTNMALDPSIALQARLPQIDSPLDNFSKATSIQNALRQGQMGDIQLQNALRDQRQTEALNNIYKNSVSPTGEIDSGKVLTDAANQSLGSLMPGIQKTMMDQQSSRLKLAKETNDLVKTHAARIMANPTLETALSSTAELEKLTGKSADSARQELMQIGNDPQALYKWAAGHALDAEKLTPHFEKVDTGGSQQTVAMDPLFGKPTVTGTYQKTVSPDAALHNQVLVRGQNMTDARQRESNGIAENGVMAPMIERNAQAIANGQLPPLGGFALKTPLGMQTMSRVMEINPNYNAADFGTNQKSLKDFATGKQGNAVRSFNVALSHLDTLDQLADALNNRDTQLLNKVGNAIAMQTGNPAPTNFAAAKKIVADEIVKAIVGSGGGVTDREEAAKAVDSANSPAQLKGVITTYKTLMNGQLGGLKQQYETTTGRKDFNKFLSPEAQAGHSGQSGSGLPSGWSVEAH